MIPRPEPHILPQHLWNWILQLQEQNLEMILQNSWGCIQDIWNKEGRQAEDDLPSAVCKHSQVNGTLQCCERYNQALTYGKLRYWQWFINPSRTENLTSALSVRPCRTLVSRCTRFCHTSCRHGGKYNVFRCISLPTDLINTDERAWERQSSRESRSVGNGLLLEIHGWLFSIGIFLPHAATNVKYLAHP